MYEFTYLITICMTTNHNAPFPAWNQPWNIRANNGFSKHCSPQNIPDGSIWGFPHLFQLEFYKEQNFSKPTKY